MEYTERISNQSILGIVQRVCNYVDPRLMDHGLRVSYLVWNMLAPLGTYTDEELRDICFISIIHDIGAYKTEEISRMLDFETDTIWEHSIYGYLFIKYFSPLRDKASSVMIHHVPWNELEQQDGIDDQMKEIVSVLFLADRIDVSMEVEHCTWEESLRTIRAEAGTRFSPKAAALADNLNLTLPLMTAIAKDDRYHHALADIPLTQTQITDYLKMIIFSIDFRSRHTVTHTVTTTSISYELACLAGLDETMRDKIVCGALLHDVGKIGIPVEILEFPGRLSPQAMAIMRTHVDITDRIFDGEIEETVRRIALRHHEKMNGTGYPLGLKGEDLTIPERIVAIADIISALSGTRSYKEAYGKDRIISILTEMKGDGLLDPDLTDTAILNFDLIMGHTQALCDPLLALYHRIQEEYQELLRAPSLADKLHLALQKDDAADSAGASVSLFN